LVAKEQASPTLRGYDYVWKIYVKAELETRPIDSYHTIDASEFLTGLNTELNANSLHHVRALMSGIFAHAVNTKGANGKALIDRNPIRDVKVLANVRESKERVAYSVEETIAIINAIERTDAKLFFALCAVLGMRPSEAAAVKWENVSDGVLKVREAAPYGVLGALKTKKSKRDLDIIEPVASLLKSHHEASGKPTDGLLFQNDGQPIDHNGFAKYYIKPFAKKVCNRWNGCYSGRHGAATAVYNQEGDLRGVFQVLGNSLEVAMKNYVHADVEQGRTALAKHGQRLLKAMQKGKE